INRIVSIIATVRVLIYGRVSRDPRQLGRSVDEQVVECTEWAEREGWEVVRVVRETASASRYARVERRFWDQVVSSITDGEIDALLTWESSRATRDLEAYAAQRVRGDRREVGILGPPVRPDRPRQPVPHRAGRPARRGRGGAHERTHPPQRAARGPGRTASRKEPVRLPANLRPRDTGAGPDRTGPDAGADSPGGCPARP